MFATENRREGSRITLGQLLSITGSTASLIALALVFIDKLAASKDVDPQLMIWRMVLAIGALLMLGAVVAIASIKVADVLGSNATVTQKILRVLRVAIIALTLVAIFADGLYAALYWRWWLGSLVSATKRTFSTGAEAQPDVKKGPAGAISKETLSRLSTDGRTILLGSEVVTDLKITNSAQIEGFMVQTWSLKGQCEPYIRPTINPLDASLDGLGNVFTVEVRSTDFDPYLLVFDRSAGFFEDDDSAGRQNARLIVKNSRLDAVTIAITASGPHTGGSFTLRARCGT